MIRIGLLHAAIAAIAPVNDAMARLHPDWAPINLLDDGIQEHFRTGNDDGVSERLGDLARIAAEEHRAVALLATCSAARFETVEAIGFARGIPCIKIDFPMCELAVGEGGTIGVIVSFPPTEGVTRATLDEAARRAGVERSYQFEVVPEALVRLNRGDRAAHDALVTASAERLVQSGVASVVLAQVSMAHLAGPLSQRLGVPVLESLSTSLAAVRLAVG